MVFTEPRFLAFFLLVFAVYWSLRSDRARKWFLLVASYVFYSAWDWRFSSLLLASTVIDYVAALRIEAAPTPTARKRWITVSLVANLGILGFFKYWNFFATSAHALLTGLGFDVPLPVLEVVLPVGVSFYTFQTLSYALDVYRGTLAASRSLLDFALFVAFFPQLVAGPIVRACDFLPQLDSIRLFRDVRVKACLTLFLIGYLKKACVADHLAPYVDAVFAHPAAYSGSDNWLGLIMYWAQIYCDFSGYSDMALATAGLLGYRLAINFDFPYFARNIPEFWRRWHISLSTWLRDYLYVSLGGGRISGWRTIVNLFVTFGLCGLWHGAAWHFVVFGLLHAALCVLHMTWKRVVPDESMLARSVRTLGIPLMNVSFMLTLVVFRCASWGDCSAMFDRLLFGGWTLPAVTSSLPNALWLLLAIAAIAHLSSYLKIVERIATRLPEFATTPLLGASYALALFLAAKDYQPFVYFQF